MNPYIASGLKPHSQSNMGCLVLHDIGRPQRKWGAVLTSLVNNPESPCGSESPLVTFSHGILATALPPQAVNPQPFAPLHSAHMHSGQHQPGPRPAMSRQVAFSWERYAAPCRPPAIWSARGTKDTDHVPHAMSMCSWKSPAYVRSRGPHAERGGGD